MTRHGRLLAAILTAAAALAGCQQDRKGALSVVVSLPRNNAANVAKGTVLVDYSGTGARILSEGGGPACAFILPGVDGDFSDDGKGTLTIHTSGPRALHGPADIAACRMLPTSPDVSAADIHDQLSVRIAGAEDAAGKVIDVTSKAATKASGPAAVQRTDDKVEEEQEDAVKAAKAIASAAPPRPVPAPAAETPAGAAPGKPPAMGAPNPAPPAAAARPTGTPPRPATPGAAVPGGASGNPGQGGNDGGAAPTNQDKDPSYDDSPSADANAPAYTVEVATMPGTPAFGALQFDIVHLGRNGGFIGGGDEVECVPLVEAIVAGNYVGERVARIGMIQLQGVRTGTPIIRCGFRTREALSPASFQINVTDASDTNSEPLDPPPTVVVSNVFRR